MVGFSIGAEVVAFGFRRSAANQCERMERALEEQAMRIEAIELRRELLPNPPRPARVEHSQ